jgi:hypothetical protein
VGFVAFVPSAKADGNDSAEFRFYFCHSERDAGIENEEK